MDGVAITGAHMDEARVGSESCTRWLVPRVTMALATALTFVLVGAQTVAAQGRNAVSDSAARDTASQAAARCTNVVNPHNRSFVCNTSPVGTVDHKRHTLSQDWVGVRTSLSALGFTPTFSYLAQPMVSSTTAVGSRGWSWIGQTDLGLAVNGEKLFGLKGFQLYVAGAYAAGPPLSDKIGNEFAVQGSAVGYGLWLTEFYVQETLVNGHLTVAAGRLAPAGLWSGAPVFGYYINGAVSAGSPDALFINDFAYTAPPPGTQWGIQALYTFSPAWELGIGVFNNNPKSSAGADNGLDWTFRQGNSGALLVAQVNYLINQGAQVHGLRGQYSAGSYYDGNVFTTLPTGGGTVRGKHAVWVMGAQTVYRAGDQASQRGLTVWGTASYSWPDQTSQIPWSGSAGASWTGLFSARSSDVASVGGYFGKISSYIPSATAETALEVNYRIAVTGGVWVAPVYQYVWRPSGTVSPIPGASVAGVELLLVL
jgi:porin